MARIEARARIARERRARAIAPNRDAARARDGHDVAEAVGEQDQPVEREIAAASQNIRVGVNLLENLMTVVSELVLTRNSCSECAPV